MLAVHPIAVTKTRLVGKAKIRSEVCVEPGMHRWLQTANAFSEGNPDRLLT